MFKTLSDVTEELAVPVRTRMEQIETTITHLVIIVVGCAVLGLWGYVTFLHVREGRDITAKWVTLQFLWLGAGALFLIPKRLQAIVEVLKDKLPSWGGGKSGGGDA